METEYVLVLVIIMIIFMVIMSILFFIFRNSMMVKLRNIVHDMNKAIRQQHKFDIVQEQNIKTMEHNILLMNRGLVDAGVFTN